MVKYSLLISLLCCFSSFGQNTDKSQSGFEIVWGSVTNGIKAGVGFNRLSTRHQLEGSRIAFYLGTSETNLVRIGIPPREERLVLKLTDTANKEIQKTSTGKAFGRRLTNAKKLSDLPGRRKGTFVMPPPSPPTSFDSITTLDIFKIPTTDDYILSGAIVIFRLDEKNQLTPLRLPFSAKIPIRIEE
jgi:hypothetical protein